MKKTLALLFFSGLGFCGVAQSVDQLKNTEITFILVESTSTKCEIFYSDGEGEIIPADMKKAKDLGLDPGSRNLTMVVGTIIGNGWKISSTNTSSSGAKQVYFVRE